MTDRTDAMRKTLRKVMASLVAATIGMGSLATPAAAAGGSISLSITPGSAKDARAVHTGLALYSLFQDARSGAIVRQHGNNNAAALGQNGRGNLGIVHQEGNGHSGTLQQNGNRNAYGLFQFGRNANGHVAQHGHGQTGATFQFGW
jgi:hypothetical protein